jgi:hypothetical protein
LAAFAFRALTWLCQWFSDLFRFYSSKGDCEYSDPGAQRRSGQNPNASFSSDSRKIHEKAAACHLIADGNGWAWLRPHDGDGEPGL